MYSCANFEISLTAYDSERDRIAEFLAEKLEDQTEVFCVEEWPATSFHVEKLAIELAQFTLQVCFNASFNMEGYIVNDYASSDFSIAYANGMLTIRSNEDDEYEAYCIQDECPDYENFCERFWDEDNDCPMYTEEEYEEFCTWEPAFVLGDGQILQDEPTMGTSKRFRITQNAVISESSFANDEDDDFEEDDED